ncbi:probable ribose-5-phosphate isomerase 4, chloroplastic isoform X2 [Rosa chinensis]|uniref:probable ribose-5-phosphate isomerase 4, chloroplastic isoform X2 n=1 Tax=Rosa chinensis TaxID=74649 RepID=UPI000D095B7D|nr:probable ribose-5-phosphate isomerase 4, chloroplastic isoform X2 [Rosa chinensis]
MALAMAAIAIASPNPLHSSLTLSNARGRRALCTRTRRTHSLKITGSSLADGSALFQAAHYTVDTYIKSGMVIGLGSGIASGMAMQYIGLQLGAGALKDIVGIPTRSVASASEAAKAGIPLGHHEDGSQIDFAFDDADIIEERTLIAVIGRTRSQGEESIIQEKTILNAANKVVFIVRENQYKCGMDGSIPVLVNPLNWMETAEEIDDLFLGDAEVWRRPSVGLAGPHGGQFPLVTREGHNVIDVIFTSPILSLAEVSMSLDNIDGVIEHGIISKFPCTAVIASESGPSVVDNVPKNSVKEP